MKNKGTFLGQALLSASDEAIAWHQGENMTNLNEDKQIIKLEKKLGSDYSDELRRMSITELETKLFSLAKYKEEIVVAQKNDEKLRKTKEEVKELRTPYRESKNDNKLRSTLVYLILKEKEELSGS